MQDEIVALLYLSNFFRKAYFVVCGTKSVSSLTEKWNSNFFVVSPNIQSPKLSKVQSPKYPKSKTYLDISRTLHGHGNLGVCNYELHSKHISNLDFYPAKENMTCKPGTDLYTYSGTSECDGWSDISLEDCKLKCLKNEMPENCTPPKPYPECHLIMYVPSTRWCHLGESCSRYERSEGDSIIERKTRKWHPFIIIHPLVPFSFSQLDFSFQNILFQTDFFLKFRK